MREQCDVDSVALECSTDVPLLVMSYNHSTPLNVFRRNVTDAVYVDEVLRPIVVPFFEQHQDLDTYQHDTARPHTATVNQQYLAA
jgi:hypothetical protein